MTSPDRIRAVVRVAKRWFVQCPQCLVSCPSGTQDEAMRWAATHVCAEQPSVE